MTRKVRRNLYNFLFLKIRDEQNENRVKFDNCLPFLGDGGKEGERDSEISMGKHLEELTRRNRL